MSAWTNTSSATSVLYQARTVLPAGALELACHAAVPAVLDVGFLHLLRANFFLDPPVVLDFDTEAELLNSPLFQEVGEGLYEVEPQLRRRLLAGLDAAYGFERLKKVALLLELYTNHADPWQPRELEYAQRLTALSIVEPLRAADWLANAQRSVAGRESLGPEWFFAMRERLTGPSAQPDNLAAEHQRLLATIVNEPVVTAETMHALGQLALLPGADLSGITRTLQSLSTDADPAVAALARAIGQTIREVFRPGEVTTRRAAGGDGSLLELLDLESASATDLRRAAARPRREHDLLRVPIGTAPDGTPVILDLKEAARGGVGPHGLLVGANGSGKSELMRTLVTALAITHTAEMVNFLLIDGSGASFAPFDQLPHTAGVVTGLAGEPALVDRLAEVIEGELVIRQEALRLAGNYSSVRSHEQARAGGAALSPLPSLLIVIDEVFELLALRPGFVDLLVQVGRLGRSLGIHLLLAGRQVDEGRLRGLGGHLSYRLGLRMFSSSDSRAVLGVPDASELPRSPGNGYLRSGGEQLFPFKAAYVSGRSSEAGSTLANASLLDVVVESLRDAEGQAIQVWLPPLTETPMLDEVAGPLTHDPDRGLMLKGRDSPDSFRVPIALVDRPRDHAREAFWLQLRGSTGHVAVIGGRFSGKSTTLRTFVLGLALTHTPDEAQVYCVDFGGGSLSQLRDLPHVGGIVTSADDWRFIRTIGEISALLDRRERRFAELELDSMDDYRRNTPQVAATRGRIVNSPADVFLVVDGWPELADQDETLASAITNNIARRGLKYGVHVVVTAPRWADLRAGIGDLLGSRIELRLEDPGDSVFDPRAAMAVPNRPGHGLVIDTTDMRVLHVAVARPLLGSRSEGELVEAIGSFDVRAPAPSVSRLPSIVPYEYRDFGDGPDLRLPIGIAEDDLERAGVDFSIDPHLFVHGDSGCGKSSFLRALATTISRRFTPDEARILIIDHKGSLADVAATRNSIGYGIGPQPSSDLIGSVAGLLATRVPGRAGPELFVLVDDYDGMPRGHDNPLRHLEPFLSRAGEVGLHLVVTNEISVGISFLDGFLPALEEATTARLIMSAHGEFPVIDHARQLELPPGRGRLDTSDALGRMVQLYYLPENQT